MYFIEDQDPILVKQELVLDEMELRKLYQEITVKFGKYVHRSYDGSKGPYDAQGQFLQDYKYIKNFRETPLACEDDEKGEKTQPGRKHFEYDEYSVPELARLILRLLEGDASAITELKRGPFDGEADVKDVRQQEKYHRELQALLNSSPDEMDQERFSLLTRRISSFYKAGGDAEQMKELQECYQKVLSCVQFKSVKTLYKDKLNEFRRIYQDLAEFYEGTDGMEKLLKSR